MKLYAALFALFSLLCLPTAARAACWDQCYQDCGSGMKEGAPPAGLCTSRCHRYCTDDSSSVFPRPVTIGPHVEKFGAIAVSPTTLDAAYSYNFNTKTEAVKEALRRCTSETPGKPVDCRISLWFSDSCAALAMYKDEDGQKGSWSTALGGSRVKAETAALKACGDHTQKTCAVMGSFCSP